MLERIHKASERIREAEQIPIVTEHVLHGGMYARTITVPPKRVLEGAFIKVPSIVITVGCGAVLAGERFELFAGIQVRPASAGRKQIFVSADDQPLVITMIYATTAKTIEDAEAQFTDDADLLLSRQFDANIVVVTGE